MKPLISFCEPKYDVMPQIAEFWNTISNIGFLLVGWKWFFRTKQKFPPFFCFFTGIGSILFHATIHYWGECFDEFAMIFLLSSLIIIAYDFTPRTGYMEPLDESPPPSFEMGKTLDEKNQVYNLPEDEEYNLTTTLPPSSSTPKKDYWWGFTLPIVIIYGFYRHFLFFFIIFSFLNLILLYFVVKYRCWTIINWFSLAFLCWIVEQTYCDSSKTLFVCHGLWHLFCSITLDRIFGYFLVHLNPHH